jgi:hypothetical protein
MEQISLEDSVLVPCAIPNDEPGVAASAALTPIARLSRRVIL